MTGEDPKHQWGRPWEDSREWKAETRLGEVLWNFFQITKNLNSLEVSVESEESGSGAVYANFLFSLEASYHSLKHLRVFGGFPSQTNQPAINFALFENLKILTLNYQS